MRTELFDCLQANLALLADRFHGAGTHLALGAPLRFDPVPGPGGLPTVEPSLATQLDDARSLLGLEVRDRWSGGDLRALVADHGTLYVVADAFDLPWVPYHGQRHLEHSFLVSGTGHAVVEDAYDNQTPWGPAVPGRWELAWTDLPSATEAVLLVPAGRQAPTASVHTGPVAEYAAAYAEHRDRVAALDRLTLETWLLARSRHRHAAFLGAAEVPEVAEQLRAWDLLTEQAFLALRRVQRGRPEPTGLIDRLAATLTADRRVFDPVYSAVAEVVASTLDSEPAAVLAAPALTELRGFNSFRVVEIVERLEERLGIEFDPADLVPENLHRLDDLSRLATKSGAIR